MIWLNLPQVLCYKNGTDLPPGKSWIVSDPQPEWTEAAKLEESFNCKLSVKC